MSGSVASLRRQWIPIVGGSCDVRMGFGALEQSSAVLKASVGAPHECIVVFREGISDDTRELLRRQLVDAGFEVFWHLMGFDAGCTLDEAYRLQHAFATHGITGDDLCCALGDESVLAVASYVCGSWCAGTSLAAIPTSETAFLEGALVPRALDVDGLSQMIRVGASARHVLLDLSLALSAPGTEDCLYARALMVSAAMATSERAFSELWDRADAVAAGEEEASLAQLLATAKSRGQAISSTAAAVRQSITYGDAIACAMGRVCKGSIERSTLLGESLRLSARLAVGLEKLPIDDMLAQDELLEILGVGTLTYDIDPDELVMALKGELFLHSRRFMLPVPFAIGRVRLATIPDDMLREHIGAWCAAHAETV